MGHLSPQAVDGAVDKLCACPAQPRQTFAPPGLREGCLFIGQMVVWVVGFVGNL